MMYTVLQSYDKQRQPCCDMVEVQSVLYLFLAEMLLKYWRREGALAIIEVQQCCTAVPLFDRNVSDWSEWWGFSTEELPPNIVFFFHDNFRYRPSARWECQSVKLNEAYNLSGGDIIELLKWAASENCRCTLKTIEARIFRAEFFRNLGGAHTTKWRRWEDLVEIFP